jgi:DNA-binding MarR family transcriptional regulator
MKKMIEVRHGDLVTRTYALFMQIAQAANKYSDSRLQRNHQLKTATYLALQGLTANKGVMSHTQLAEWTNTRKHNITSLVNRMKNQGLVTAQRSTEDRRLVPIIITEKGRKLFDAATPTYQDISKNMMHGIVSDNVTELEGLLKVIKSNIEQQSR